MENIAQEPQPTDENGAPILPPDVSIQNPPSQVAPAAPLVPEAQPTPNDDGGATLSLAATTNPSLIASIEVYRGNNGVFHVNFTSNGHTLPQYMGNDVELVRGFIDNLLVEKMSA